jgi:hypothetical protein
VNTWFEMLVFARLSPISCTFVGSIQKVNRLRNLENHKVTIVSLKQLRKPSLIRSYSKFLFDGISAASQLRDQPVLQVTATHRPKPRRDPSHFINSSSVIPKNNAQPGGPPQTQASQPDDRIEQNASDEDVQSVPKGRPRKMKSKSKAPKSYKKYKRVEDVKTASFPNYTETVLHFASCDIAIENFKARARNAQTYWSPPENDHTIPQTDEARQDVVRFLKHAMQDLTRTRTTALAHNPYWQNDSEQAYDNATLETVCWEIEVSRPS